MIRPILRALCTCALGFAAVQAVYPADSGEALACALGVAAACWLGLMLLADEEVEP